ncbi:MAG: autotransporter outer membrane beta-barrel domain-containing protein, partial [Verrucomicrobiaceae bacterium]
AHPGLRPAITYLNNRSLADLPVDYDLIAPDELTSIFDAGRAFTQVEVGNIENRLQEIRNGGGSGFSARGLSVQKKPVSFSSQMPAPVSSKGAEVGKAADIYTARADNPWGVFIAGSAESMDIGNDGNAAGFDVETGGMTLGLDLRPNEYSAVGIFQQYTNSDADLVNDGRVDRDGMKFGLYGTIHNDAGFYMNGLIAAGHSDYSTRRLGLGGFANGKTEGWDYDAMIGGGYTARTGGWTYGPLATLTYSRQQIDKFTETGSMLPLVIEDQYGDSLVSRIGAEVSYEWKFGGISVSPSLSVAWEHEFLRDYQVDARLAAAAANGFTTSGATIGRDSLDVRAGLGVQWNDRFSTHVSYQCELGRSNYSVQSFSLGLHLEF